MIVETLSHQEEFLVCRELEKNVARQTATLHFTIYTFPSQTASWKITALWKMHSGTTPKGSLEQARLFTSEKLPYTY